MYSGHDLYLHCLINFLEIKDKKNFGYLFDDEQTIRTNEIVQRSC